MNLGGLERGLERFAIRAAAWEESSRLGKCTSSPGDCLRILESRIAPSEGSEASADETAGFSVDVVSGLSGEILCKISDSDCCWRVRDIKARIEQLEGIDASQQRLLFEGRFLADSELIDELGTATDISSSSIQVVLIVVDSKRSRLVQSLANGSSSLLELPVDMREDKELVMASLKGSRGDLQHAGKGPKADFEVVLTAVRLNGLALRYADVRLQDHEQIVLTAVEECGLALGFASQRLRTSPEVFLAAIRQHPAAARFVAEILQQNEQLAQEARNASAAAGQWIQ